YYVGLGDTQESAFEAYLQKLSGITPTASATSDGIMGIVLDKDARIDVVLSVFEEGGITIASPTSIQLPLSFSMGEISFYSKSDQEDTTKLITKFINEAGIGKRILMWEEESIINFGYLKVVDNITELHYISIEVGR
ncbi:MAG: hypothetical protein DSN69_08485, partial [Nitrosopumilus sp. YT1]